MADDIDVLVVEDDAAFATLIRLVFDQEASDLEVRTVQSGAEALEVLSSAASAASATAAQPRRKPVLLLDLGLPDIPGTQLLALVRDDPTLREVPVAVLTGSTAPQDLASCLELGVNAYITKTEDLDDFIGHIRGVGRLLELT
jgi:CheY-like chemotaxis protein